jgi:hypothetical protein
VGQSFVARGVNLISAAVWVGDGSAPVVVARVLNGGPGGAPVGTSKRNKPARLGGDPEMTVVWAPGECPLVPNQTYYLELSREGGGTLGSVYANPYNQYADGQAYTNGVAISSWDLAANLMQESRRTRCIIIGWFLRVPTAGRRAPAISSSAPAP